MNPESFKETDGKTKQRDHGKSLSAKGKKTTKKDMVSEKDPVKESGGRLRKKQIRNCHHGKKQKLERRIYPKMTKQEKMKRKVMRKKQTIQ